VGYNRPQRSRPCRGLDRAGQTKVNQESRPHSGPNAELFRLAAVGAFAPAVAHTLNNLLNIVSLRADSIELSAEDPAALAEDLRVIRRNLDRSAQLLAAWSELSRTENSAAGADLRRECEAALGFAGLIFGKKFAVVFADDSSASVQIPPDRLRRAVLAALFWIREGIDGDAEARIRIVGGAGGAWSIELEALNAAGAGRAGRTEGDRAALTALLAGLAEACGADVVTDDATGMSCALRARPR
jgi:hypothetical protein